MKRRHQARIANQTDQSDDYFAFLPSDTITTTILGASSFVIVDDDVNNMPTFSLSLGADSSSFVQVTQAVPNSLIKRGGRMQQQQQQTNFLSSSSSNEPSRSMMKNVYCGKVRLVVLRPASLIPTWDTEHGTADGEQGPDGGAANKKKQRELAAVGRGQRVMYCIDKWRLSHGAN